MSHMHSLNGMILGTRIVSIDLLVRLCGNFLTYVGSWDAPPQPGEFGYRSFQKAFKRFLTSRTVRIRRLNKQQAKEFDDRKKGSRPFAIEGTPNLGQSPDLKLMPFQVCVYFALLKTPRLKVPQGWRAEVALPELVGSSTLHSRRRNGTVSQRETLAKHN
jgi:hypothetical protein